MADREQDTKSNTDQTEENADQAEENTDQDEENADQDEENADQSEENTDQAEDKNHDREDVDPEEAKAQAEEDARRQEEEDKRLAEEKKRRAEEERRKEEERKAQEAREAEEMRRSRLIKPDDHITADWDKRTLYKYRLARANEFDQGMGCFVRGSNNYREDQLNCKLLNQLSTTFSCVDSEELVSNVISIGPTTPRERLKSPIIVVMPHCTSRASAMTREPVIKAEVDEGRWVELTTYEVSMEDYKDMKCVQAEVSGYSNLAVVTRFKRDFLHMSTKGRVVSNLDARVSFTAEKGTFKSLEHFVMQFQSVDSATLKEVAAKNVECQSVLTSSSIVSMEWTSKQFGHPVKMTLPCPPNPVKAKKDAASRAAKDAKRKNPAPRAVRRDDDDDDEKIDKRRATKDGGPKPTKWYMGQYGANEEDDSDQLFFVQKNANGRWAVMEQMAILQIKMDIVQLELREPISRFVVLRTRTSVEAREAQQMAEIIEQHLNQRAVNVIVKQRSDDQSDAIMHVTPVSKSERLLRQLEEDGYDDGPAPSGTVYLKEGDMLNISFRGNIDGGQGGKLEVPFNSNMKSSLSFGINVVDTFLQKSYNVYRGFVQLQKKVKLERRPTKQEASDGVTGAVKEVSEELVCELLVNIPKEHKMIKNAPASRKKAPVVLKNTMDPVDQDILRHLAVELRDEWQVVAHQLNVKRMRIQSIRVDHHHDEHSEEGIKYDMLMTWAKKAPRGVNKADILRHALMKSGRSDLAKELQDLNDTFQKQQKADRQQRAEQKRGGPESSGQDIEA